MIDRWIDNHREVNRCADTEQDKKMGELEGKLAQSAAGFLGKQMEQ